MNEKAVIDIEALRRLLAVIGGDREGLAELIGDFREGLPELVGQIVQAANEGDVDRLRVAAHSLKSNARDFGALELSEVCAALEAQARSESLDGATGQANRAAELAGSVLDALSKLGIDDV